MSTVVGTVAEIWRYPFKSMAGERLEGGRVAADGLVGDRGWAVRDEKADEIRGARKLPKLMLCRARYLDEPREGVVPHVRIEIPGGESMTTAQADAAERLSRYLGRTVSLWPRQPASERDHYRRGMPDNPDFEAELRDVFARRPDEPLPDITMFSPELMEFTSPLGTYFDAFALHVVTTATLARLGELNRAAAFDRRRFRPNLLVATPTPASGFVETDWCGRTIEIGRASIRCEMPTVRCGMTTHEQEELPKDPSVLRTIVRDAGQNVGVYGSVVRPGDVRVGDDVRLA